VLNRSRSIRAGSYLVALWSFIATAQGAAPAVPDITGAWERVQDRTAPSASRPQLKPEALKEAQAREQKLQAANAAGKPLATHNTLCLGNGMPGMMNGPFPIEILQTRGQVTIIQEGYAQIRRILLDRKPKSLDEVEPGFFGYSVGHWAAGALLVDTIGIKESVQYQPTIPHTLDMHIRERIYYAPNGLLRDEITIEDPAVLEKPYTYTLSYKRMPDYQLLEYICEDNLESVDHQGAQLMRADAQAKDAQTR